MKIFPVVGWALVAAVIFTKPALGASESDVDRLLELLVEKKVLTTGDAIQFRSRIAISKQEDKEKQKEFSIIAGKPVKVSGYIQPRYQFFEEKGKSDTFDIRRSRLDIRGDITERFDYRTQVEFGGTNGPFLLDAALGYKFDPALKFTIGQFKIPFSLENLTSSPKLETINRSQVVEALVARGKDVIGNQNGRDIGIQASGEILPYNGFNLLEYAIGIFNGYGINRLDINEQKDLIGRVVIHPIKDLSIGTSYYVGRFTVPIAKAKADSRLNARNRVGGEFAYVHGPVSLKGEYIWGIDGATAKRGWYAQAGYFVIPEKLQAVFKYDTFNPNADQGNVDTTIYTLGANWYLNKWAFLQVNYEIKDENPSLKNNAFIVQATLQF